jgi:hypothetical protein
MSKIVQAVNAMISNSNYITDVLQNDGEYFFLYKKKYKWSVRKVETGINLFYYPTNIALEVLANFDADDWGGFAEMIVYRDADIGTKEARSSFQELFTLVKEKVFGIDEVLDDIISDDDF